MNKINEETYDFFSSGVYLYLKILTFFPFSFLLACKIVFLFSHSYTRNLFITAIAICLFFFFFLIISFVREKGILAEVSFSAIMFSLSSTYAQMIFVDTKNGTIWLLLFTLFTAVIRITIKQPVCRKVNKISAVLGTLFGIMIFLGYQLELFHRLEFLHFSAYNEVLLYSLSWFFLFLSGQIVSFVILLRALFILILKCDFEDNTSEKKDKNQMIVFLVQAGIILLFWLPYYIAFFPGIVSLDSIAEIYMQLGISHPGDHSPAMHQWIIGICLNLGKLFKNNPVIAGIGIYSALQMSFLACVFSKCILFLRKLKVRKSLWVLSFCFFALFGINAFYSITMWKNVLFGGFSLLLILYLLEDLLFSDNKRNILSLILTAFMFSVMQKNGFISFFIGFLLFMINNKQRWRRYLSVLISACLLFAAYKVVVFNILHYDKGLVSEAMSVPLQQIARVINVCGTEDEEEIIILKEVFPEIEDLGEKYKSYLSDPVKVEGTFLSAVFSNDPLRYIKCWIQLGIKHPLVYLDALFLQSYGYWYPNVQYWSVMSVIDPNILDIRFPYLFSDLREGIRDTFTEFSQNEPTTVLFSLGGMVWALLVSLALLCIKGQRKLATPLYIIFILWLTTLGSAVYCEYRYLYGLVVCVPLYLSFSISYVNNEEAA